MEPSELFKIIQKYTENHPLFFIGSGSSAACGLPGMEILGKHLLSELSDIYSSDSAWQKFEENLKSGQDLEKAMTNIVFNGDIINNIRKQTWELISKDDLDLFNSVLFANKDLPLSRLIKKYFQAHPSKVDIITTNYDRVIEYACDKVRIPVNTGFSGCYSKYYSDKFSNKNAVNLVKVHGSLDLFKDSKGVTISLPLQQNIPVGLTPEIITPGISKYQAVLTGIERSLLNQCDSMIKNASSYLCIGYGFNDTQIQALMINEIQSGKPLVLLTKDVSEETAHLLANNATNYAYICNGAKEGTTDICINRKICTINGTYWTVEGFMDIID